MIPCSGDVRNECEEDEGTESAGKPHVIRSKKLRTIEIMIQAAWLYHFHFWSKNI
jgi:hypothetical protein